MDKKYMHFRVLNQNSEPQPRGGATALFVKNPEKDEWYVAVALCSKADNFCKKIGRNICTGRLVREQIRTISGAEMPVELVTQRIRKKLKCRSATICRTTHSIDPYPQKR
jgi:hypothetical protein